MQTGQKEYVNPTSDGSEPPPSTSRSPGSLHASAVPQEPSELEEQPVPHSADASKPSLSGDSDELGAPTRVSIRACARTTPPGPPRDTPSPVDSCVLAQSTSDDTLGSRSIPPATVHISSVTHSKGPKYSDPPPAIVPSAHAQEQMECLDRRQHRHPSSQSARRRHHKRDHREHDRCSRTSPSQCQVSEPRLPAPPVPPLRPLQLTAGGPDVLKEISLMLASSRRPLSRTRVDLNTPPRRENDVLDDIYVMVRLCGL